MPRTLVDPPLEAIVALHDQGLTVRGIAERLGISRSFAQRTLVRLHAIAVKPERRAAGDEPLPAGHPLSWCAISAVPFETGAA